MKNYDFDDFLNTIKHLDLTDALSAAQQRHRELVKTWGVPNRKEALILSDKINGVIYWLETGDQPTHMLPREFVKLKPLCENLIAKQQLKPGTLAVFNRKTLLLKE
jgi:hypothetical protein